MIDFDSKAQWPGWETVRRIGRGSYGAVYEIQRIVFGHVERAALKVISIPQNDSEIDELVKEGLDSVSIRQRYESYLRSIVDEFAHMADMKGHPNIVYIDDVRCIRHDGDIGWDVVIKMELLTPLKEFISQHVPEETVRRIGVDIANALIYCEEHNIVHQHINPQNIFVTEDGTFKLEGFSIESALERVAGPLPRGVQRYAAPEFYSNRPCDARSDVYSLGLVLYWLLNERRLPFLPLPPEIPTIPQREDAQLRRMRGEPLPPPQNGSDELKRLVLQACEFDPERRFTASELHDALSAEHPNTLRGYLNDRRFWEGPIFYDTEENEVSSDKATHAITRDHNGVIREMMYYLDDQHNVVPRDTATQGEITEYDAEGHMIKSIWFYCNREKTDKSKEPEQKNKNKTSEKKPSLFSKLFHK